MKCDVVVKRAEKNDEKEKSYTNVSKNWPMKSFCLHFADISDKATLLPHSHIPSPSLEVWWTGVGVWGVGGRCRCRNIEI